MSNAEANWERLVRVALQRERGGAGLQGLLATGITGNVPSSLPNNLHIEEILVAVDEIQDEDPNISRICVNLVENDGATNTYYSHYWGIGRSRVL